MLSCGVAVGVVDCGKGVEEDVLGMPKGSNDPLSVIGTGVECR